MNASRSFVLEILPFLIICCLSSSVNGETSTDQTVKVYMITDFEDADNDGRLDLYHTSKVIEFLVCREDGKDGNLTPLPNVTLMINITMGAYRNTTMIITDRDGMGTFHYGPYMKDTHTGFDFQVPAKEDETDMAINLRGYQNGGSIINYTRNCSFHRSYSDPNTVGHRYYGPFDRFYTSSGIFILCCTIVEFLFAVFIVCIIIDRRYYRIEPDEVRSGVLPPLLDHYL